MKIPRKKAAPRNLAARSLRSPLFQPKVEPNPKAYKRKVKHKQPIVVPPEEDEEK